MSRVTAAAAESLQRVAARLPAADRGLLRHSRPLSHCRVAAGIHHHYRVVKNKQGYLWPPNTAAVSNFLLHFALVVDDAKFIVITCACVPVCLDLSNNWHTSRRDYYVNEILFVCPRPHAYTIARTRM